MAPVMCSYGGGGDCEVGGANCPTICCCGRLQLSWLADTLSYLSDEPQGLQRNFVIKVLLRIKYF